MSLSDFTSSSMLTQINCSIHGHQKNVNTNRWMQNITRVTVDLDNNLPVVHHSRLRRRGRAVGGVEATSESAAQSAGSVSSASEEGAEGWVVGGVGVGGGVGGFGGVGGGVGWLLTWSVRWDEGCGWGKP